VASALLFVKELQRKNTKAEIGLANPLPYAYAATPAGASRGIVSGDNRVVEGARCCTGGPGHDAATGRGAIDLNALADYALAQAPPTIVPTSAFAHGTAALTGAISLWCFIAIRVPHCATWWKSNYVR
jgi:hypothetical protein